MRILVFGAGAIGGYFGGRLLAAGRDVTFLVRPARAGTLARTGLVLRSPTGDATLPAPPCVTAEAPGGPYDLVILACKAFDLEGAIAALAPAVGEGTAILPLLNGMRHLDALGERFGAARVLGGQCVISATLDEDGAVRHLNDSHALTFGEQAPGPLSARVRAIHAALDGAGFTARASETVLAAMWEKWVFLASLAAITCLMRGPIGAVEAAGGAPLALKVVEECRQVAAAAGFEPSAGALDRARAMLTAAGSPLTASMLRDLQAGHRTEAEHVLGDLLARGAPADGVLAAALTHLRVYEAGRK